MARASYMFTSESVSEGHPDKVADRISDEIVDLYFREGAKAGLALESEQELMPVKDLLDLLPRGGP